MPFSRPQTPLLTLPTTAQQSLTTTASADSWQSAGDFSNAKLHQRGLGGDTVGVTGAAADVQPIDHCPTGHDEADPPTGLNVDLTSPESPSTESSLATLT